MFNFLKRKKVKETTLDIQFGAFYATKTKEGYEIIRLLDLPGDSYHYQIIGSTLPNLPTADELEKIKPFILHIPMDIAAIIDKNFQYVGHRKLTQADLAGYKYYLKEMGADEKAIRDHARQLIRLSNEAPDRMRIYQDQDGVFGEHLETIDYSAKM